MIDFSELNQYLHLYFKKQRIQDSDIDDIVQESLLKIHKALDHYDPNKASIHTWATTIASRCYIDLLRRRKLEPDNLIEDIFGEESKDWKREDLQYRIKLVMDKLPTKHQSIIQRKALNEETNKQIALDIGITEGTIRWRYHMACKEFRKLWKKYAETVICQCGCETRLPKFTSRGKIRQFARGHSRRIKTKQREQKIISCACGCGKKLKAFDKKGRKLKYLKNHVNRDKRIYSGPTRSKRISQSIVTKRAERKEKAKLAGIIVPNTVIKLCCHCNKEKLTKWSGHYRADLTAIYFSRCIDCKKEYQRSCRKSKKPAA